MEEKGKTKDLSIYLNTIALRKAKIVYNTGLSKCSDFKASCLIICLN